MKAVAPDLWTREDSEALSEMLEAKLVEHIARRTRVLWESGWCEECSCHRVVVDGDLVIRPCPVCRADERARRLAYEKTLKDCGLEGL